ncbi:ATP-grasp domain-containing protein [Dielma fastidiosa]|uniref:D-Ala-D-Ala ligase-like protein n=1 Tax=Dielma fastidiosa TaxID=1034346 RepID=A0A318KER5_9FIRM|nr:ATP-grasp domain-containing protein [Dielma fastidiosa]PXX75830.1 D-Ala-D-Ala ligase-like protein [Dielma fastidiosa]
MITKEKILKMYTYALTNSPIIDKNMCLAFVYNNPDSIHDTLHISECVMPSERDMIINSFESVCKVVKPFASELEFIKNIPMLKHDFKEVFVYSMAQDVTGVGRRCLIPLLCDYLDFRNINADFQSCYLGGNKKAMYEILSQNKNLHFPFTIFVSSIEEITMTVNHLNEGKYLVKPNDESAGIGIKLINISSETRNSVINLLQDYIKKYTIFCIQEFLCGDEVEVPLLYFNHDYFCPGSCLILKDPDTLFLDYNTVALERYHFSNYSSHLNDQIQEQSIAVANTLKFKGISRIDFIISNNKPYIIDIGPNPTISTHSSTNYLFKNAFFNNEESIYILLLLSFLSQIDSFKPSLNAT